MADEITEMAARAIREGRADERPMHEAAQSIVEREERARREYLAGRSVDDTSPVDPELFPPTIFNPDGTRKRYKPTRLYPQGQYMETPAEARANFEWRDSRM